MRETYLYPSEPTLLNIFFAEPRALVGFNGKQRTSGESAAAAWQSVLSNTISEIKQLIGRRWDDPELQVMKARMPFEIVEGINGGIAVKVSVSSSFFPLNFFFWNAGEL